MIVKSVLCFKNYFNLKNSKKVGIEMDELGKLIVGLVLFIVLIYIVSVMIGGELSAQKDDVTDVFSTIG